MTVPLMLAMEKGGSDVIELGVPFTDPLADGKAIQDANNVHSRPFTTPCVCLAHAARFPSPVDRYRTRCRLRTMPRFRPRSSSTRSQDPRHSHGSVLMSPNRPEQLPNEKCSFSLPDRIRLLQPALGSRRSEGCPRRKVGGCERFHHCRPPARGSRRIPKNLHRRGVSQSLSSSSPASHGNTHLLA